MRLNLYDDRGQLVRVICGEHSQQVRALAARYEGRAEEQIQNVPVEKQGQGGKHHTNIPMPGFAQKIVNAGILPSALARAVKVSQPSIHGQMKRERYSPAVIAAVERMIEKQEQ